MLAPDLRRQPTRTLTFGVREAGQGEPILLIHGFPQDSWMWRHQQSSLEEFRTIAVDSRGYGGTDKPRVRVTRDLLVADMVDLLDALELDDVNVVGHDWGGIIAAALALKRPERVRRLGLIDTLATVFPPVGYHGWWFKAEPEPEEFFARHARDFIGAFFGGAATPYPGLPATPWPHADKPRRPHPAWSATDVDHFTDAFDDPDVWFNAISYYRDALPFHDADGYVSPRRVAEQWAHPLTEWPGFPWYPEFAPEDAERTYGGPTLLLYSRYLVPEAFDGLDRGEVPPDGHLPVGSPFVQSFVDHFSDLHARAAGTSHFVPEEDPDRTNACIRELMAMPTS